jgi:ribosomal protein L7/L12
MELNLAILAAVVIVSILNIERQSGKIRRDVARVERKLNRILQQMNINFDESSGLSDRVKEVARDPRRKIEAIKIYREETGATSLLAAKEAVEAYIESLGR